MKNFRTLLSSDPFMDQNLNISMELVSYYCNISEDNLILRFLIDSHGYLTFNNVTYADTIRTTNIQKEFPDLTSTQNVYYIVNTIELFESPTDIGNLKEASKLYIHNGLIEK